MAEAIDEFTLLCESCGYALMGLPTEGKCPECGRLIVDSLPERRTGSSWQTKPGLLAMVASNASAIRRPRAFFRKLTIEGDRSSSLLLANITATSALISIGPVIDGLISDWEPAALVVVLLPFAIWTCLMVLTLIECAGVQIFGHRSRWRITPAVAWSVCAHATAGWVLGGGLWCLSYGAFAWRWHAGSRTLPESVEWLIAAAPLGSLVVGLLTFEVLVYIGIRRCRYANRVPPDVGGA